MARVGPMMLAWAGLVVIAPLLAFLVHTGLYTVPLPLPAINSYVGDVDPTIFPPKVGEFTGVFTPNNVLQEATCLFPGEIEGVETVAVASNGDLILNDKYGQVWRATVNSTGEYELGAKPIFHIGAGRILGAVIDANGDLIACDALKGLVKITGLDGERPQLTVLVSYVEGAGPIRMCDDVDVAPDGSIYFTSASDVYPSLTHDGSWDVLESTKLELARGKPTGKVYRYHPNEGVQILAQGLWYANGVALAPDSSYILVAQTLSLSITRIWLTGPRAGQIEDFLTELPGHPDGISRAAEGGFRVTLYSPVNQRLMRIIGSRLVRAALAWSPEWVLKRMITRMGVVMHVGEDGKVGRVFMDGSGVSVWGVTSAVELPGMRADGARMVALGSIDRQCVPLFPVYVSVKTEKK